MRGLLATAIVLILVGIIGLAFFNYYIFTPSRPGTYRIPFRGPGTPAPSGGFTSNGEQIFFTGTSSRDTITITGGPFWFQMHGGGCASCHGPDGRGGRIVMMGRFSAPNITYKVLTGEVKSEEEEHEPFTDEDIKRAVTRGIEPSGEQLSPNMPRWQMSDRDLEDVIDYLKELDP